MGSTALIGAGFGLSAAGQFAAAEAQEDAAKFRAQTSQREFEEARRVAGENLENTFVELSRQQGRVDQRAKEQKSDITRQFDADLASVVVAFAEQGGAAGSTNVTRAVFTDSFSEGIALSRVEGNRQELIESLQQDKRVASQNTTNVISRASLNNQIAQAESRISSAQARVNAFLGTINSGVQIAGAAVQQNRALANARAGR